MQPEEERTAHHLLLAEAVWEDGAVTLDGEVGFVRLEGDFIKGESNHLLPGRVIFFCGVGNPEIKSIDAIYYDGSVVSYPLENGGLILVENEADAFESMVGKDKDGNAVATFFDFERRRQSPAS